MESLRSLNKKLVTQVALLRQSSNSPRAVDCAPLSSPSVVSLASSFESIDAEADDDAVNSPREDNRTWKTKLMDFLSQVETLAHQGCEMLDRVRIIDARIKEAGLQGTSRPGHYHVLVDENNYGSDALHIVTYRLTFIYCRCTKSVAVLAPVYYA
ncbi:hypothetical protein BSKO_11937 [Bryopsis sp. KO-2023]|nr:hypothetical protein BSKO_11937 [Bryopsis sp. KO-2023]